MNFSKTTLILFLNIVCLSLFSTAQEMNERQAIKETINSFFEGLHTGDTVKILGSVSKDIIMETTFVNEEGKSVKRTGAMDDFLKAVSSKKPEDVWFEKLLKFEIHIDYPLASVWTPYEFYVNGTLSHCGANSFQLFKTNGRWQIIYLIDSRKRTGCGSN